MQWNETDYFSLYFFWGGGGRLDFFQQRERKEDIDHSVQWLPKLFVPQNVKQIKNKHAKNKTVL